MFTTIMYGVINEITRQPATASLPLTGHASTAPKPPAARRTPKTRRALNPAPRAAQLPGKYRILADSFKRAAGFY